jgi:hypothetical protein
VRPQQRHCGTKDWETGPRFRLLSPKPHFGAQPGLDGLDPVWTISTGTIGPQPHFGPQPGSDGLEPVSTKMDDADRAPAPLRAPAPIGRFGASLDEILTVTLGPQPDSGPQPELDGPDGVLDRYRRVRSGPSPTLGPSPGQVWTGTLQLYPRCSL